MLHFGDAWLDIESALVVPDRFRQTTPSGASLSQKTEGVHVVAIGCKEGAKLGFCLSQMPGTQELITALDLFGASLVSTIRRAPITRYLAQQPLKHNRYGVCESSFRQKLNMDN
jgi:hypothetical protein